MNRDLSAVIEAARVDEDPRDLDPEERVEALVATAEIVGLLRSTDMTVTSARQATPRSRRGRLRRAWDAIMGRDATTGYGDSILVDLKQTADESGAIYRKRLRWLEASVGPGIRPRESRTSIDYRIDEELR